MRLLLISNSTAYGGGYLDHCAAAIAGFLEKRSQPAAPNQTPSIQRVLFVPYAVADWDGYAEGARRRFAGLGFGLDSIHDAPSGAAAAVERAAAIFIGGGNTFRLLKALWDHGLVEPIRRRVLEGVPYIGSSAGSNVACPTIKTTNDMPIVEPPSLRALRLVPFNINPHYQDAIPGSTHMGETREQRIAEFHEENDAPVVGLREGAWLLVEDRTIATGGSSGIRLFRRGQAAVEYGSGSRLDFLL
jgi:dipeptidase E